MPFDLVDLFFLFYTHNLAKELLPFVPIFAPKLSFNMLILYKFVFYVWRKFGGYCKLKKNEILRKIVKKKNCVCSFPLVHCK